MWPTRSKTKPLAVRQLATPVRRHRHVGKRGVLGNSGTGSVAFVPVPLEWRATTRQVCGLFPWASPGQLPMVGGPLGLHQRSGSVVCFDHISWFLANLIANPSVLIIAVPGLGKSTLSIKMTLNLVAQGYVPIVPGDTKREYSAMVHAVGGEVRTADRSGGAALNPCDPGGMAAAARRIGGSAGQALLAEAIGRATVCIASLVELARNGRTEDYEQSAISAALSMLYEEGGLEPLLADLDRLLATRPAQVRAVVLDHGKDKAYDALIDPLRRSITALLSGQYGDVFARRVTRPDGRPTAWSLDTSRIKAGDPRFLAAVMMAAWSDTYGMVEAQQALHEAELGPRVLYCMVLDELWRVLDLGGTLPARVNELTRLNRSDGIGQIMITHSIRDLAKTGGSSSVAGIEERAGATIIGGVPHKEINLLNEVMTLNDAERRAIGEWWSTSQAFIERNEVPPAAGKFLLKPSRENPGIPLQVVLSSVEREWGGQNTNQAWADAGDGRRRGRSAAPTPGGDEPR